MKRVNDLKKQWDIQVRALGAINVLLDLQPGDVGAYVAEDVHTAAAKAAPLM